MIAYLSPVIRGYFSHFSGLSWSCWQGILLNGYQSILGGIFFFLSYYFVNELHYSMATAGFILAFYGIGSIIGSYIGGMLSDRFSPLFISIMSLLIEGFMYTGLVGFSSLSFLIGDIFFLGVASSSFITSNYVWVLSLCRNNETDKLKSINILSTLSNLGLGLSAIIISTIAQLGFHIIFIMSSILLFSSVVYLISQYKSISSVAQTIQQTESVASSVSVSSQKNSHFALGLALLCTLLVGIIVAQTSTTYSIYLQNKFPEWGLNGFGGLFLLNALLIIFFQTPIVNLFSSAHKITMVGIGAFLMGLGMGMLPAAVIFPLAIVACIIYTLGEMIFFSMVQLVCYQNASKKKKGRNMGYYRISYAASRIIGPYLGGWLFQYAHGNAVWIACGGIGLFCLGSCWFYKKIS